MRKPSRDVLLVRQDFLVKLYTGSRICKSYGMQIHYDAEDRAIFRLPHNRNFDHALDGIHGGVIATLLDNAGWFTTAQYYENWISTVEFTVRLLEPAANEELTSIGWIIRLGRQITTAAMEVRGGDGRLIATGQGTFVATNVPYSRKDGEP